MASIANCPTGDAATEALIPQVIEVDCGGNITLPIAGQQFSDAESAFEKVQHYVFASGVAVVTTQKDEINQRGTFFSVYYGKTPNKRKLTGNTVRKELYEEMEGRDGGGNNLKRRQGIVSTPYEAEKLDVFLHSLSLALIAGVDL
ncbi:hypothetical protein BDD12DRAFT_892009 [Trichophaea hybrida]|nr:hypothetical protein BDD12DRAFT_892009 [Trichophaea hybrida]